MDEGGKLTGTWGEFKLTGSISGDKVDLSLTDDSGAVAGSLTGTISGDSVSGAGTVSMPRGPERGSMGGGMGGMGGGFSRGGTGRPMEFSLTRSVVPPAAPREIHFEPTDFFGYYSAANTPVLKIFPGDVVHTPNGRMLVVSMPRACAHRGGGFERWPLLCRKGALPGDTLVVHLLKVQTNRATAHQGSRLNATRGDCRISRRCPATTTRWTASGLCFQTRASQCRRTRAST